MTGDTADTFTIEATRDATAAPDGPFPIVLFSHGASSFRLQSSHIAEHLASWSIVTASADHPSRDLTDRLAGSRSAPGTLQPAIFAPSVPGSWKHRAQIAWRRFGTSGWQTLPMSDQSSTGGPHSVFDPPDPSLRAGIEPDERVVSDPGAPVIIGVSFDRQVLAQQYLLAMGGLKESGDLDLQDAVLVTKHDDGSVKVVETIDPTPGRAALSGAMWTSLLGLVLGGPVGWVAGLGIGAASGAVTAKIVDLGIPDEWVEWFREAVEPGTSTVVILAEHVHVGSLATEARRFAGAQLLYTSMPDHAYEQLRDALES